MDSSRIISCIATPIGRGQSDFMLKTNNAYGSSSAPSLQKRINYSQGVYETMNGKQKKRLTLSGFGERFSNCPEGVYQREVAVGRQDGVR